MKSQLWTLFILSIFISVGTQPLEARSNRVAQIPNGNINGCANCHVNAGGGGARNLFGTLVENSFLDNGNVVWNAELAAADADGDGFSNGHELEDPFGLWASGLPDPGELTLLSNPGVDSSIPSAAGQALSMQINFINWTNHMGQLFQVRVEKVSDGEQVAFYEMASITDATFETNFPHVLQEGESYDIEYWADFNGNGIYDAPPTDHSWRSTFTSITGNQNLTLTHNTNFADIGSPLSLDDEFQNPKSYVLHGNFPNPFNPETTLSFSLDSAQEVELSVFNISGKRVRTLFSGTAMAGTHHFKFNARDAMGAELSAGLYFYRLNTNQGIETRRMTLLK